MKISKNLVLSLLLLCSPATAENGQIIGREIQSLDPGMGIIKPDKDPVVTWIPIVIDGQLFFVLVIRG
jgi:hypothetical protein